MMEEGPWLFCGCALMVQPFDGTVMIPTNVSSKVQPWIQIHKELLETCLRGNNNTSIVLIIFIAHDKCLYSTLNCIKEKQ
jgi:hypothetical protein